MSHRTMNPPEIVVEEIPDRKIAVRSPFNEKFAEGARKLGGSWKGKHIGWVFPARREVQVRKLCLAVYGTDGTIGPTVDIEIDLDAYPGVIRDSREDLVIGGRVVWTPRYPGGLSLGDGVEVVVGDLFRDTDSRVTWDAGTVVEVRGLPPGVVEKLGPRGITVVGRNSHLEAMREVREWLAARLAQLDRDIAEAEAAPEKPVEDKQWGLRTLRAVNANGIRRTVHADGCTQLGARRRYSDWEARLLLRQDDVAGCPYCKSAETLALIAAENPDEEEPT